MEKIDIAYSALESLVEDVSKYKPTICTEQDTRIKVIDRMFLEVLGWSYDQISTEEYSTKYFLDYKFSISNLARLIVEAKRDGRDLGTTGRTPGRAYKLNGPVFKSETAKEGIKQSIIYCGLKSTELACVTNGIEWVIFRGSRLGDGKDTMDGMAFVFPTLESVMEQFTKFYDLLSHDAIANISYRAHFQEAEGEPIRVTGFRKSMRDPDTIQLLKHHKLGGDIHKVMTSFFRRLSGDGDPEMLSKCFVVTKDSDEADKRLVRISEDIIGRVKEIDTDSAEELSQLIQRVKTTHRNEFVILVGSKGAGKSTFIDRFFRLVLNKHLLKDCIIIKIDLKGSDGDENEIISWLNHHFLEITENALFGDEPPMFNEIQGMFFDEYRRMSSGTLNYLYKKDKDEFKIEFGKHIENIREQNPHDYICRLIRSIAASRKKIPCIIFDNADHFSIEFQEKVFQFARAIYENEVCLTILPITDRTSWQLSKQGPLQSFDSEVLYLPTPSSQKIIEKRIAFIQERIAHEKKHRGSGYFFGRGIELSIENLEAFAVTLNEVFINTGLVARWIDNLANRDIRRALELTREIATSPHLDIAELLKAYISQTAITVKKHSILKAIIRGKYNFYPVGGNKYVQNIYALNSDHETTPLLGLRILQLLRDARRFGENNYITVNQVIDYFMAMTIEPIVVWPWLSEALSTGLCLSYNPTVKDISNAQRISLSPSGFQHLYWGKGDKGYLSHMLLVTPIQSEENYLSIQNYFKQRLWDDQRSHFVKYLTEQDQMYCQIPNHVAYTNQKKLLNEVTNIGKRYLNSRSLFGGTEQ